MIRSNRQRRIGAVTIGQSPRTDVVPELLPLLGPGIEVVEVGALDALSPAAIAALAPAPGDEVLVSRLRNGQQVRLRKEGVPELLQAGVDSLAGRVEAVLLLCTGSLPPLRSPCPILYPEHLLFQVVRGILGAGQAGRTPDRVGILTPDPAQTEEQRTRWTAVLGAVPAVAACSPYVPEGLESRLERAATELLTAGARMIVLDCLGYSRYMKHMVHRAAGIPVILARTVLARVAAEVLDDGNGRMA